MGDALAIVVDLFAAQSKPYWETREPDAAMLHYLFVFSL